MGQNGLCIDGSHAQKGDDPHPEDGPRPAGEQSAGGAHNVARANLGSNGGSQGLKGAHAALLLFATERQSTEYLTEPLTQTAHLNASGLKGEKQSGSYQQE